ncbi:MAG: hypothetical protein LBV18_06245 [Alistipes sp.]|jgi:hypothetical protein|nr:hypothetical protein [Alistipes sp.]
MANIRVSGLAKDEKSLVVDFPIDVVKRTAMEIFNSPQFKAVFMTKKGGINEVLNTYSFTVCDVGFISMAFATMTLESVDENKTRISLVLTNPGSKSSTSLDSSANYYLMVLGKALAGERLEDIKKTTKSANRVPYIIAAVVMGILMLWYFLS